MRSCRRNIWGWRALMKIILKRFGLTDNPKNEENKLIKHIVYFDRIFSGIGIIDATIVIVNICRESI